MHKYQIILDMSERGHTRREIAEALGCKTEYVCKVISGKYGKFGSTSTAHRCPGCGGMVYGNCRACRTRREMGIKI